MNRVTATVDVDRPGDELYHFWRNFANIPRFMGRLETVTVSDHFHSHWSTIDAGPTWDVEVVADVADELIAWRSVGEGDRDLDGTVRFFQGGNGLGTQVWLEIACRSGSPPASLLGRDPDGQIREDMQNFGRIMAAADSGPDKIASGVNSDDNYDRPSVSALDAAPEDSVD